MLKSISSQRGKTHSESRSRPHRLARPRPSLASLWPGAVLGLVIWVTANFANSYLVSVATFMSIHALGALSILLLIRYAGLVSFGQSAYVLVGAYTSAILTVNVGLGIVAGALAAAAMSGVIALIIGALLLRSSGHNFAIASLALALVAQSLVDRFSFTGGFEGIVGIPSLGQARVAFSIIGVIVLAIFIAVAMLERTSTGLLLKSIGEDEYAATASGFNPRRWRMGVFVASAMVAAVAGSLLAHTLMVVSPSSFGLELNVMLVFMLIVGGTQSVWGALLGATIVGLFPVVLGDFSNLYTLLYGIGVIVVLLLMPHGVSGGFETARRRAWGLLRGRLSAERGGA